MTSFRAAAASAAFLLAAILASCLPSCAADERGNKQKSVAAERAGARSDNYWKKKLDPEAYQITRCGGTEAPFSGKYWNNHETGVYRCSNCGALLFDSTDKYDSGTGWPSFSKAHQSAVLERKDRSHGMVREEVICKHCGAHLGHLFDDGPAPTGQRFCINSASLNFDKAKQAK